MRVGSRIALRNYRDRSGRTLTSIFDCANLVGAPRPAVYKSGTETLLFAERTGQGARHQWFSVKRAANRIMASNPGWHRYPWGKLSVNQTCSPSESLTPFSLPDIKTKKKSTRHSFMSLHRIPRRPLRSAIVNKSKNVRWVYTFGFITGKALGLFPLASLFGINTIPPRFYDSPNDKCLKEHGVRRGLSEGSDFVGREIDWFRLPFRRYGRRYASGKIVRLTAQGIHFFFAKAFICA